MLFAVLFAVLGLIPGVSATVLGIVGRRKVDRGEAREHRGKAQAGLLLGIVAVILAIANVILGVVLPTSRPRPEARVLGTTTRSWEKVYPEPTRHALPSPLPGREARATPRRRRPAFDWSVSENRGMVVGQRKRPRDGWNVRGPAPGGKS